jgi:hypothetical protein
MVNDRLPRPKEPGAHGQGDKEELVIEGVQLLRLRLHREETDEEIPGVTLHTKDFKGTVVVWIHPDGKSSLFRQRKLVPAARAVLERNADIWAPDMLLTGEFCGSKLPPVNDQFAGYTFGYNRPLLANRVHDILTSIAFVKDPGEVKKVHLIGFGKTGPWVILARGLCGDAVTRTAVDANQFDFDQVKTTSDDMMLPGALKYGGLTSFAALCAPGELYLHNIRASSRNDWIKDAYKAAGAADHLKIQTEKASDDKIIDWLLR